ncbi:MAG: RusA family crossover junction endodeoxyribonuclease [Saprospiraceae bacterium]|nr:RusA family crossover junction endodeoxyribonuclease [Saprospiraceae bacterium]
MNGDSLFTNEFIQLLNEANLDFELIKNYVIRAYNQEKSLNISLDEELSESDEQKIAAWINTLDEHPLSLLTSPAPVLFGLALREKKVKIPVFSGTLSNKVNFLSQFHCPICKLSDNSNIKLIPLKINPQSKQALSKIKGLRSAYEEAIAQAFVDKEITFNRGDKLCVLVVFVLSNLSNDRDLDNMSKALMDALQGNLFHNDADIDHLNLFKIRHKGKDSFAMINIRNSSLNNHDDVLFKNFKHKMLVYDAEDYFQKKRSLISNLFGRKSRS